MRAGRNRCSVRRSRVVLAPRPWRLFCGRYPADNGDNKRRSPGRARISRQTIARGKSGCLGCTCQTRVRCFPFCTRCCGRSQRPAFPAPSAVQRDNEIECLGRNRVARTIAAVVARLDPTRFTRLENRLKFSDLDTPRFSRQSFSTLSAITDKTHVFRGCVTTFKRCVNIVGSSQATTAVII